jgi:hypothetical protein
MFKRLMIAKPLGRALQGLQGLELSAMSEVTAVMALVTAHAGDLWVE